MAAALRSVAHAVLEERPGLGIPTCYPADTSGQPEQNPETVGPNAGPKAVEDGSAITDAAVGQPSVLDAEGDGTIEPAVEELVMYASDEAFPAQLCR